MKNRIIRVVVLTLAVSTIAGCDSIDSKPPSNPEVGFTPKAITLKEVPNTNLKELVDQRLIFVDAAGVEWHAPKGTYTDGASVPRLALWITDGQFDEKFLKAAVVHDAHCQEINETRCPDQYRTKPWKAVHRMFHEACLAGGTSSLEAGLMFAAVWLGGPSWNDPERNLDQVSDERLKAEWEECEWWIKANDPTIEEIEGWMEERVQELLAEHE